MRSKLFVAVAALAVALTCLPESASAAPGARGFGVRAGVAGGFRGGPRGGILRNVARAVFGFGQRNVIRERVIVNQVVQPVAFAQQAQFAQVVVPQVSQVIVPTVATAGVAQAQFGYNAAVGVDACAGAGFNAAVYGGGGRFGVRGFGTRATCR